MLNLKPSIFDNSNSPYSTPFCAAPSPSTPRPFLPPICLIKPGTLSSHDSVQGIIREVARAEVSWIPDSVRDLFQDSVFVDTATQVLEALQDAHCIKKHIVWQVNPGLLLAWERQSQEKQVQNRWTLKIICHPKADPNAEPPPHAGGLAALHPILTKDTTSFHTQMSEWTAAMKTRIDPLAAAYANIPSSVFSEQWLRAVGRTNGACNLFLPLEPFRIPSPPLPNKKDEKGYLRRFMTKNREITSGWWLYKAWMRPLVAEDDYKRFHFLHRFTMLDAHEGGTRSAVAAKLLRSLQKKAFVLEDTLKDPITKTLQQMIEERPQVPPKSQMGAMPIMPSMLPKKARKEPVILQKPAPHLIEEPIPETVKRIQWHEWKIPEEKTVLPGLDDPLWDISAVVDKPAKIRELADQYKLLRSFSYMHLVIFKRLLNQLHPKLGESISFINSRDVNIQGSYDDPESYAQDRLYWQELMPKESVYIERDDQFTYQAPPKRALAELFLSTLEGKPIQNLSSKHVEAFQKGLEKQYELALLAKDFPKATAWLAWFVGQPYQLPRQEGAEAAHPEDYAKESSITKGEAFDPWNYPRKVAKDALPYIGPEQALINYQELHISRKFYKNSIDNMEGVDCGLQDLFSVFFQEAWQTEPLAKQAKTCLEKEMLLPSRDLLAAKASGRLPWVESLHNPQFCQMVEHFLEAELALYLATAKRDNYTAPLLALIKFSALLARVNPALKVPDFESHVATLQHKLLHMDGSYFCRHDLVKSVHELRLHLFWLYAEKGEIARAQQYRPLTLDEYKPATQTRILTLLQTLPDLAEEIQPVAVQICKTPFDWAPAIEKTFGKLDYKVTQVMDNEIRFESKGWSFIGSRSYGTIYKYSCTRTDADNPNASKHRYELKDLKSSNFSKAFLEALPPICNSSDTLLWQGYPSYMFLQKGTLAVIGYYSQKERSREWEWKTEQEVEPQVVSSSTAATASSATPSKAEDTQADTYENTPGSYSLPLVWWSGESIVVTPEGSRWKLQDRPHLYWQEAREGIGLHNNELVDAEKGCFHVFHVPLSSSAGEKMTSFSIAYSQGKYQPKELEEYLCLLLQYSKTKDFGAMWKLCQELPLIPHRFSAVSKELMQQIIGNLSPPKTIPFDELTITMQIFERFHTWLETPSLETPETEFLTLGALCLNTWELYRDVASNMSQELLLTIDQRENLSGLQPKVIKKKLTDWASNLPEIVDKVKPYIKAYIKSVTLIPHHRAWRRDAEILAPATYIDFIQHDFRHWCERFPLNYETDPILVQYKNVALRIACVFARFLGSRFVWAKRVQELQGDFWIPREYLTHQERILRRLELAASPEGDWYRAALIDYAVEYGLIARNNESVGAFLGRVEQHKHTQNILYKAFSLLSALFNACRTALKIYKAFPIQVSFAEKVRVPFELFRKTEENIPLEAKQEQILVDKILSLANERSEVSKLKLAALLEEKVQWSHLQGLFLQNGMRRLKEINPSLSDETCDRLDALVHEALIDQSHSYTSYNPQEKTDLVRALLVFEKTTGMKVRPEQKTKITTFRQLEKIAMQMAMGEGKTSVLTSLMLVLGAKPGRISIYMPPAAQYTTLATMLTRWQKTRFGQEVIPIQMNFACLQKLESLEWLLKRLRQAKTLGHAILLHPNTAHSLKLCYMSTKDPEQLKVLFAIRNELKEHGDVIIDEIDQLLDPFKDTSMAAGDPRHPTFHQLNQLQELLALHERSLDLWKALCHNLPQEVDQEKYLAFQAEVIAPVLAEKFKIPVHLRNDFYQYIVGKGKSPDHDAFLKWLSLYKDRDAVALHKHWLEDILPFTILRERGRHYGRANASPEIVSYAGVGSPTTMKFAQLGEEMSYYFLNALSSPLEEAYFKEVVDKFIRNFASYQQQNNGPAQDKVCNDFHKTTGFDLKLLIRTPSLIQEALARVNDDPIKKLRCEVYLAHNHLTYFASQLTSTSQDLFPMFSTHRGFSGTFPGYVDEFDHHVEEDAESDESVRRAMREHNEEIVEVNQLDGFFVRLENDGSPLGGLVDVGALFRDKKNEEVARQVLRELPSIDTVLFFGKRQPSDETPDTPCIMKRLPGGKCVIHVVGSTDLEVLKAWGVKLETLFVLYDQRHAEATDVVQLEDRRNAVTFGLRTTERDLLQAVMRMRKYKNKGKHQRATWVLDATTKQKLFGGKQLIIDDIIEKSKEIQKEETKGRAYRTYFHRINAAFLQTVEDYIGTHISDTGTRDKLQAFCLHHLVHPSAYTQFGGISKESTPILELQKFRKELWQQLAAIYPQPLPQKLTETLDQIEQKATQSPHLAKTVTARSRGIASDDVEEQSHQLAQQEQGQQQEQRQEQEIRQEVEQTQVSNRVLPQPPTGKRYEELVDFQIIELSSHYGSSSHEHHLISKSFEAELFSGLYASQNWVHTYETAYPLNHPDQKKATYLLLERGKERLKPTILSGYDYQNYRLGIKQLPPGSCICYWRPAKDGALQILKGGHFPLNETETIQLAKIRLQIAFLNGNGVYIANHLSDFVTPPNEMHSRFLQKRVEYWQLRRERMEWWWLKAKVLRSIGIGRIFFETNYTELSDDYSSGFVDIHGRHYNDFHSNYERREVLNIVHMLEADSRN